MIFPATIAAAASISIQNTRFIPSPVVGAILSPRTAELGPFLTPSTPLPGPIFDPCRFEATSLTPSSGVPAKRSPSTPAAGLDVLVVGIETVPVGVSTKA